MAVIVSGMPDQYYPNDNRLSGGQCINPYTGVADPAWPAHSIYDIHERIESSWTAHLQWKQRAPSERAATLNKLGELLRERKLEYAQLIASEMGKPIQEGISEVEKCASACDYYSSPEISTFLEQEVKTDYARSYTRLEPLGVILLIMPWNFPFWQVFRAALPALLVGNGIILKHAPNVPSCAQALESFFREVDMPPHLFAALMIPNSDVSVAISHPLIQGISVTGSTKTGKAVASTAGSYLKKTVLELGGSDPYVVLADADLDLAARECVQGRMINGGQSCIAAKRFLVDASIAEEFTEKVKVLMQEYAMGDPLNPKTRLGPMAREDLRDALHQQVHYSIKHGARLIMGGEIPNTPGWFYPPTILADVKPGMPVFDEETFGPVAAICPFRNEDEAWELAGRSSYGLGAAIFSRNEERAEQLAKQHLRAGSLFINTFVRSDPRLPFGGTKQSGYGRELGTVALHEFANLQTIVRK
jgi:succinate-semialdehyde dehydrogenase/glutarate-semialdehyde dehydrogenase